MTEVELQSELMSYADRFASIITQAMEDFESLKPKSQARQVILSDLVYSISSVYTIAAEPNPQVGLLDMVALTVGVMLVPLYMLANVVGAWVFDPGAERLFRGVAYLVIAASAILGLPVWGVSHAP